MTPSCRWLFLRTIRPSASELFICSCISSRTPILGRSVLRSSLPCFIAFRTGGHDRDRSGKIHTQELREALLSLGYAVSPAVLDLLVLKFDKAGGEEQSYRL